VLIENTSSTPTTVAVQGNSIHDFDGTGISVSGKVTATVKQNEIVTSNSFSGSPAPEGIVFYSGGTIADNIVITHPQPPGISAETGISVESDTIVAHNTVENFTIGIWLLGNSNEATSNRILLAGSAIVISGANNDVEFNSLINNQTSDGGDGISLNCTGIGNTVIHNTINDTYWGIVDSHGVNTIAPNSFSNVTYLVSPPC
jgi:hypothetical protein